MARVFIAGGTGYVGRALIAALVERGHLVRALARPGSEHKLPVGCTPVTGSALDPAAYSLDGTDSVVHLVGVAHPSPSKAAQFVSVDLASARAAITAGSRAGIRHFVYVSVAHPAPVMQAYIAARVEAEESIRKAGLNATILRPWYILGPGHRWPLLLLPAYWLAGRFPRTREAAQRLGLVTLGQMVRALVYAVEHPVEGVAVRGVPEIRAALTGITLPGPGSAGPPAGTRLACR